jgi:hypothetical protein
VEAAAAEVLWVGDEHYADFLAVNPAAVVAPVGCVAPDLLLIETAVAVEDAAAVLYRQRGGDADAEAHFFLVAEGEVGHAGVKSGVDEEQGPRGAGEDRVPAGFRADRAVVLLVVEGNTEGAAGAVGYRRRR